MAYRESLESTGEHTTANGGNFKKPVLDKIKEEVPEEKIGNTNEQLMA